MTSLATAVGLALDLLQCVIDLLDSQPRLHREGQVPLAVDGHGAALPRLLVELDVPGLTLEGQRVGFGPQIDRLLPVGVALLEQLRSLLLEELDLFGIRADGGALRRCRRAGGLL